MIPDPASQTPEPARVHAIRAGLLCRCPSCGEGRLFRGFLRIASPCEACGFDLADLNTGDGPATFIMQIAGFVVAFSALYVEIAHRPPMWVHLSIWPPLVVALALGLMRPGKGLMMALELNRRQGGEKSGSGEP